MTRAPLFAVALAGLVACASDARTPSHAAAPGPAAPASAARPAHEAAAPVTDEPVAAEGALNAPSASAEPEPDGASPGGASPAPEFPKGTLVLHVGDSFAGSLGDPLGKRLKTAGVHYVLEFQDASYVPTWASGKELPKYIARYNPDFVIVTLGANEIEIPHPDERAGAVRRLVRVVGERPCLWILPPLWKPDTGFMKVIAENAAPCRVLDSTALVGDLPRKRDKIHPNAEGRERWADAVIDWLGREREPNASRPWAIKGPR